MLFMVELHYSLDHRDAALRYFWEHGSTHYPGEVTVNGAWVATHERIAFALVEAGNPESIAQACQPLEQFGKVDFHQVTSVDEI